MRKGEDRNLACDGRLPGVVLRCLVQHLEAYYRDQAKGLGHRPVRCGDFTYLTGVGLPAEPPTIAPPRPRPQQPIDFTD